MRCVGVENFLAIRAPAPFQHDGEAVDDNVEKTADHEAEHARCDKKNDRVVREVKRNCHHAKRAYARFARKSLTWELMRRRAGTRITQSRPF